MSEVEEWKRKASFKLVEGFIWAVLGSRLFGTTASEKNTLFAAILLFILVFSFNTGEVMTNAGKSLAKKILPTKDTKSREKN